VAKVALAAAMMTAMAHLGVKEAKGAWAAATMTATLYAYSCVEERRRLFTFKSFH
jgi:hypothetical protein